MYFFIYVGKPPVQTATYYSSSNCKSAHKISPECTKIQPNTVLEPCIIDKNNV